MQASNSNTDARGEQCEGNNRITVWCPKHNDDLTQIRAELQRINAHHFIRAHDSWLCLLFFNLLRGLAFGLCSVLGATLLVSVFVYLLSGLDFIPILGDWAG